MAGTDLTTFIYFIAAILPAIVWLWFWLQEDYIHPEPKTPIVLTFFAGALSALFVLPIESFVNKILISGIALVIAIAVIEEIVKFGIVAIINFKAKYLDEAVDYAIYLITGAMGFAAMENILFLAGSILDYTPSFIFFTTNIRFLGATVLHGLMAAILGILIGYVHHNPKIRLNKTFIISIGLAVVIGLHALFNYFIIGGTNLGLILVLGALWIIGIVVLFLFERTKRN